MNCKHGIPEEFCAYCNPQEIAKPKSPQKRKDKTVHGAGVVPSENMASTLAFVSIRGIKNHPSHTQLNHNTTHVHINGMISIGLMEKIKKLSPNVQQIQLIPGYKRKITKTYLDVAKKLGIQIVYGHKCPELKWMPGEAKRTHAYTQQRKFFQTLSGEQKELFDELVRFGFDIADMAQDYYLSDADNPMFAHDLCVKYGFTQTAEYIISAYLYGLMHYLDPTFNVAERSIQFSNNLHRRVERIRAEVNSHTAEKELAAKLGLNKLPEKLPMSKIEEVEIVLASLKDGRLDTLQSQHPTWHRILMLRFGLESFPQVTVYRSLEEVTEFFDSFKSRERVRQIEQEALNYLTDRCRP